MQMRATHLLHPCFEVKAGIWVMKDQLLECVALEEEHPQPLHQVYLSPLSVHTQPAA
jgi:hypothetical protein